VRGRGEFLGAQPQPARKPSSQSTGLCRISLSKGFIVVVIPGHLGLLFHLDQFFCELLELRPQLNAVHLQPVEFFKGQPDLVADQMKTIANEDIPVLTSSNRFYRIKVLPRREELEDR
jgi:hypothetical protein